MSHSALLVTHTNASTYQAAMHPSLPMRQADMPTGLGAAQLEHSASLVQAEEVQLGAVEDGLREGARVDLAALQSGAAGRPSVIHKAQAAPLLVSRAERFPAPCRVRIQQPEL